MYKCFIIKLYYFLRNNNKFKQNAYKNVKLFFEEHFLSKAKCLGEDKEAFNSCVNKSKVKNKMF